MPYSRDYQAKYHYFRRSLPRAKPHVGPQIELHINRKDVMETSFRAIMSVKDVEVFKTRYLPPQKKNTYITFFSSDIY